jgi:hypothetical protein
MKFGAPGAALARPAIVNNTLVTTRIIDLRVCIFVSFLIAVFAKPLDAANCPVQMISSEGHGTFTQSSQFAHESK